MYLVLIQELNVELHALAGDIHTLLREEVILNLEDSPLPVIAREVLVRC